MIERNNTSATLDRIFEEVYNIITEANRIPLTEKIIIEESDLAGALDELKAAIPKEVRNASQVLEEQKSIVNKAYEEADRIVQQAKAEAERIVGVANAEADRIVQEEEIVKQANAVAEEIRSNALRYQEEVKAEEKPAEKVEESVETPKYSESEVTNRYVESYFAPKLDFKSLKESMKTGLLG